MPYTSCIQFNTFYNVVVVFIVETYLDSSIIRNILKCELTIKVSNCTIGSTFHHHTGTDYRLTCLVKDSTRNGFALCKGPYSQYG